ncbi:MAG: histidine kinase dimerization/phospho-acceptor domain-containing protein [Vicinamibacterales bacterium]
MSVPTPEQSTHSQDSRDRRAGTRVELPRLLSVLAHEIRGPLSVLQGYIRLMQRQREEGHPEAAMLRAMLDATGRITTLSRQASDLSVWLDPRETPAIKPVSVLALLADVQTRVGSDRVRVAAHDETAADAWLLTANAGLLAAALGALAESLSRDMGNVPVQIRARIGAAVTITFDPDEPLAAGAPATVPATVAFDRGGMGLSLVLASYVLDAHNAQVTTGGSSMMEVQLQKERGPE